MRLPQREAVESLLQMKQAEYVCGIRINVTNPNSLLPKANYKLIREKRRNKSICDLENILQYIFYWFLPILKIKIQCQTSSCVGSCSNLFQLADVQFIKKRILNLYILWLQQNMVGHIPPVRPKQWFGLHKPIILNCMLN